MVGAVSDSQPVAARPSAADPVDRYWSWLATNKHLAGLPAVVQRDIEALDAYGASGRPGSGVRVLIRFVLAVWNDGTAWASGSFLVSDLGSLDHANTAWVAAWFQEPWWP